MRIIPAIDLKNGNCVRLYKGDFNQVTIYDKNPINTAKKFQDQGCSHLHVVDLDGARVGESEQLAIIEQIATETNLNIQYGGGIRNQDQVKHLLESGINQVVIGSLAVKKPESVIAMLQAFGSDKIILALDVMITDEAINVATNGWQQSSNQSLWTLLDFYLQENINYVLCTDISRDGTLTSPNFDLYKQCQKNFPMINYIASGGISCGEDINKLAELNIYATVVGKAIYENKIDLRDLVISEKHRNKM